MTYGAGMDSTVDVAKSCLYMGSANTYIHVDQ